MFLKETCSVLKKLNAKYLCSEMIYLTYFCSYICRIYLVGQSAGAHIAACALLNQAIRESGEGDTSSWSVSQLKAYFGISGG